MTLALPLAVLVASLLLTYFFCIRPMRRGACAMHPRGAAGDQHRAAELKQLRQEIDALRRESPSVPRQHP